MSIDLPEAPEFQEAIKVFYSYAQRDQALRDELEKHLGTLKQQKLIKGWHNRDIQIGIDWMQAVDVHLDAADIILVLISADFMASDYCYSVEMQRAIEKHKAGEARVIPVILRPVDLEDPFFASLRVLPTNGKPITSWPNRDEAFKDVAKGIRTVVQELKNNKQVKGPLGYPDKIIEANYRQQSLSNPPYYKTIDTQEAMNLFRELIGPNAPMHLLCLTGDAKMGKTHLLTKVFPYFMHQHSHIRYAMLDMRSPMYHQVPAMLDLACNQLGITQFGHYQAALEKWNKRFRGSSRLDVLDIQARDRDLTTQFLRDLSSQNDKLFIFLFDTVNDANDYMQMWLIDIFLAYVSTTIHIRTVIAGRSLPSVSSSYETQCKSYHLQAPSDPEDFILYCQELHAQLVDQSVRDIAYALDYVPGMFVELVYPKFIQSRRSND